MAHQPNAGRRGEGEGAALTGAGETIAAISTPPGRGGVGVVRVSGRIARDIGGALAGAIPAPRHAMLADFHGESGELIDRGIVLFFPAPHSYTGEDVVELQAHGAPLVLDQLLHRCVQLGARIAQPGEFTRRAFLNDRLDLAQAESVADLIDAASVEAARSAARSLAGEFSSRVNALAAAMLDLRMHVEACIDFPEEEIDPADRVGQQAKRAAIAGDLEALLAAARQGAILREGLTVVLVGAPNVGKSSLLNRLAGEDLAIVTPVAGTTRDYVRARLAIQGVPMHLIDTAGLRATDDPVERVGIERTWRAVQHAGAVLLIESAVDDIAPEPEGIPLPKDVPYARVLNKIDLAPGAASRPGAAGETLLPVSAKTGEGIDALRRWLLEVAGWKPHGEGLFMARARHLAALEEARAHLERAANEAEAYDLQAEELRLAHHALGRITGEVSADDLLAEIFSRFCIGK